MRLKSLMTSIDYFFLKLNQTASVEWCENVVIYKVCNAQLGQIHRPKSSSELLNTKSDVFKILQNFTIFVHLHFVNSINTIGSIEPIPLENLCMCVPLIYCGTLVCLLNSVFKICVFVYKSIFDTESSKSVRYSSNRTTVYTVHGTDNL